MKPVPFDYVRAESLGDALGLLGRLGAEARPLAGGQSLLAAMNMRMAAPETLVDLSQIPDLQHITLDGDQLLVGAMVRHATLGADAVIARHTPLFAAAIPHIAHPAIRNRGTIGGSLCQADPASELPACLLAMDGRLNLQSDDGGRQVSGEAFFEGTYTTCLRSGELLVSVEIPVAGAEDVFFFSELTRRHGDFAMAGLAATANLADGVLSRVRLAFFGVSDRPMLATAAAAALEGLAPSTRERDPVMRALAEEIEPLDDLTTSAATKGGLMRVLLGRALDHWAGEDTPS